MPGLLQQRRDELRSAWVDRLIDVWLQTVAVGDLFAPGGRALGFHGLGLLFAGRFGSLSLLFLGREWRVWGGTDADFERIWEEKFAFQRRVLLHWIMISPRQHTYWFHFRPFYVWVLGSSRDHWQNGPERKEQGRKTAFRSRAFDIKVFHCCPEWLCLIKTKTRRGKKAGNVKH